MKTVTLHAPPFFWGDEVKIEEYCGNALKVKLSFDTDSSTPATFTVRVHLPTSFIPIEFVAPASKIIDIPEDCFHLRLSLKSHFTGQIVTCQIS